jgi:hypothetical protein
VRSVTDDAHSNGRAPAHEVSPGQCRVTDMPRPAFRC